MIEFALVMSYAHLNRTVVDVLALIDLPAMADVVMKITEGLDFISDPDAMARPGVAFMFLRNTSDVPED